MGAGLGWARSCLSVFGLMCLDDVSVCLSMCTSGGVGRSLVSLCFVLCVFMMSLVVAISTGFCFSLLPRTSFERKGGLRYALPSSDTKREKKQCFLYAA